jgi:2-polyprenyl-3-methyl-5-hydroxy-6-metoxy-1,4-benzoquinol methylase
LNPDPKKVEAFVGKVLGDAAGFTTVALAALGDRHGLFKDMAGCGPQSPAELAACTKTDERYVREWLSAMAAAGYVRYDPASGKFTLPDEHVPALAQEAGPAFFGGAFDEIVSTLGQFEALSEAFRSGGGVPQSAFNPHVHDGLDRFTASWHENLLLQVWIPSVPAVQQALERGIRVADVGCGRGRAIAKLAQAFPRSTFVGYDIYAPNVEKAQAMSRALGVSDRVRFEVLDASKGLPSTFDLVTTFDVVHDSADPAALLASIRKALRPGGHYLNLDINCSDKLEENLGPIGALLYGVSVLYCMTTSLAQHGAGLGTMGLPPSKMTELGKAAGFRTVRKLPLENPFNNLYELTA